MIALTRKGRVRAALAELGSTPDEIAASLRKRNITGYPGSPEHCPLFNYLNDTRGLPVVAVSQWFVTYETWFPGTGRYSLTEAEYGFVRGFDRGDYPGLDRDLGRLPE